MVQETGAQFGIVGSPEADRVFPRFADRSPEGALAIPPLYTGAFHFDASFWQVSVPVVYGQVVLDQYSALLGMPRPVMAAMFSDTNAVEDFKAIWADCLDYGQGFDDRYRNLAATQHKTLADDLALSADREIRSCVSSLLEIPPNPKAIDSARMATEMILKAGVCSLQRSTDDQQLKKRFRHDLQKLLDHVLTSRHSQNGSFSATGWPDSRQSRVDALAQSIPPTTFGTRTGPRNSRRLLLFDQ
jgi:hypothetical protein